MRHKKGHLDVNQEEHSKEPSTLCQKQNSETGNHKSSLYEASPASKQEPYDDSESHGDEKVLSCKNENEKASDILMQKPNSDPVVPAQESNPPRVSHLMRNSSKIPKDEPPDFRLRQSPDSGVKTSAMCDGERTSSVKREMVAGILLPGQSGPPASQPDKQKLTQSTQPEKALEKLQPRRNPDAVGCSSQSDQVTIPSSVCEKLSSVPKDEPQPDNSEPRQCLDARDIALPSKEEKVATTKGESGSQNFVQMSSLSIGVPLPQPDQANYTYSTKFEKVEKLQPRRNPDPVVQESQSNVESKPSKVPDRGLDDGYNWRKYGQKLVKGNKFIRSYYKCTYPNCQAKKQVERSHDGCKTDVNYLGKHQHQKPQQSPHVTSAFQVRIPEMPVVSASTNAERIIDDGDANQPMVPTETSAVARSADGVTGAVSCSNDDNKDKDDNPDSKRQKRDITADDLVVNKSNCDLRHVVQTLSEVDIINDGYRWRKYGQKLVKGNPNPRSYYRCSYAGCPVKKHVERASHDSKLVITTYEGKHEHDMPASRTVNQSITRGDANMMTQNGESSSKPEENNPVSLEMAVHVSAN